MTDATGRLNLSCRGQECGKRPNRIVALHYLRHRYRGL